jgi:peptide-methionine (S)-S-oxide reductase
MRQGNDMGSQYRSAIYYTTPEQLAEIEASKAAYEPVLKEAGYGDITTEIAPATTFYYAEPYHQQYLSSYKNPNGYRCHSATGVPFPPDSP